MNLCSMGAWSELVRTREELNALATVVQILCQEEKLLRCQRLQNQALLEQCRHRVLQRLDKLQKLLTDTSGSVSQGNFANHTSNGRVKNH